MPTIGCDQHGPAAAFSPKGETTSEPLLGLLIVTLAMAGAAHTSNARRGRTPIFMGRKAQTFFRTRRTSHKIILARVNRAMPTRPTATKQTRLSIQPIRFPPDSLLRRLMKSFQLVNYTMVTLA